MITDVMIEDLRLAQEVRNKLLGKDAISTEDLADADRLLSALWTNEDINKAIVPALMENRNTRPGMLVRGWYTRQLQLRPGVDRMRRFEIARIVISREFFLLSVKGWNNWRILDQACDLRPLEAYGKAGCRVPDLGFNHFFLHSNFSVKNLPPDVYRNIDRGKYATILFPMYEGEIVAAIIAFASALIGAAAGVEYGLLRLRKKKEQSVVKRDTQEANGKTWLSEFEDERDRTIAIVSQMLLEKQLRQIMLFNEITTEDGAIEHADLEELYAKYIPMLDRLRSSSGSDLPEQFQSIAKKCRKEAEEITPIVCTATTQAGSQCRRVAVLGTRHCWQHSLNDESTGSPPQR